MHLPLAAPRAAIAWLAALLAMCVSITVCGAALPPHHKYSTRLVRTKYGPLRGIIVHSHPPVEAYLGVPYATPPLGTLRYMPPVTPSRWRATRLADVHGAVCPQRPPSIESREDAMLKYPRARLKQIEAMLPLLANQSEDCLYVNLYVPTSGEMMFLKLYIISISLFLALVWGIEVRVAYSDIKWYNKYYIPYANLSSLQDGRNGKRTTSLHGTITHPWGDNITVYFVFYEYLSNEYRPTFVEFKFKLCQLLSNDPWFGSLLSNAGLKKLPCPIPAGSYHLMNMTGLPLPASFPFKKGKVVYQVILTQNNTAISEGEFYLDIEKTVRKAKKP